MIGARSKTPVEPEPGDRFMKLLGPDETSARARYELLSARLVKFFEWRHCSDADDLAQETMMRVFAKIEGGLELKYDDNTPYFFAVAKNVLMEAQRTAAKAPAPLEEGAHATEDAASQTEAHIALEQSLVRLSKEDRRLLIEYYLDGDRKDLCRRYRLTEQNLRVRVHRRKEQVKKWVTSGRSRRY